MKYLLDTCVISELIKTKPNKKVVAWVGSCQEETFSLSTLTIGEIQKGITKLPGSKRKEKLQLQWSFSIHTPPGNLHEKN